MALPRRSSGLAFLALAALSLLQPSPLGLPGVCPGGTFSEHFHEALAAARDGDLERAEELAACLGPAHAMAAYLDFHRLRVSLPEADPGRVHDYQERYAHTPLDEVMARLALRRYAEAGRDAAVRAVAERPPEQQPHRCQWWQAQLEERRNEALAFAAEAWQVGRSQPAACNGLFDAARAAGVIDDEAIWQRMRLAFRQRESALLRYLAGLLEQSRWESAADWLLRLDERPEAVTELGDRLAPRRRRELAADALYRLARADTGAALEQVQAAGDRLPELPEDERRAVREQIAWYATIRGVGEHELWRDRWLWAEADGDLLEQRARRAVIEQDWRGLRFWLTRLPGSRAQMPRWQYWRGRALAELGELSRAHRAWREAARSRGFWGFVAAERIGRPYALSGEHPDPRPPEPRAALMRTAILQEGGAARLARQEWRELLRSAGKERRSRLAAYAYRRGWPGLTIMAAREADADDALAWRFPLAFAEMFEAVAEDRGLDPYLLMALARRESAYQVDAASGAGARGLMQVRLSTAREVARRTDGIPTGRADALTASQLLEPRLNVELGARYMDRQLARFGGNRVLALAAYNAGPSRLEEWLAGSEAKPFDVWIESIPYRETRTYVQGVLAYRAILVRRGKEPSGKAVLADNELARAYGGGDRDGRWLVQHLEGGPLDRPVASVVKPFALPLGASALSRQPGSTAMETPPGAAQRSRQGAWRRAGSGG